MPVPLLESPFYSKNTAFVNFPGLSNEKKTVVHPKAWGPSCRGPCSIFFPAVEDNAEEVPMSVTNAKINLKINAISYVSSLTWV